MKTNLFNSKIRMLLLGVLLINTCAFGATYTAVASGKWSSTATWGGTKPPFTLGAVDQVTIGAGLTVTMDSTVTLNGLLSQLSVAGTLTSATMDSLVATSGTITGAGSITVDKVVLNTGGAFTFTGTMVVNTLTNSIASLGLTAQATVNQALNLVGIISVQTGGNITMGAGSTINVLGGSLSVTGGTLSLSSAYSVNYAAVSTTAGMELSGSGLGNVTVNVSSGNTVSLGSAVTLNDSLKLVSGSLALNGYSLTLKGAVTGSGTFSGDANANLIIAYYGTQYPAVSFASDYQTLNNLSVSVAAGKSFAIASNLAINGTLNVNGLNSLDISSVMLTLNGSYSGTGSLMVNGNSGLDIEGSASITPAISISGTGMQNFKLNIGSGNTVTLGSNLTVDTINLASGTLVLNSHNLSINGNIAASGTGVVFATATSNVSVTASSSTTGVLSFSYPGNSVNIFNVNIGAAGSVMVGSDMVINKTLNLINGHVNIGANNLQIAASGSIVGANNNTYIITGIGGYLTMSPAVSTTVDFPIGTSAYYSPASIMLNSGSSTGTVGVNASTGVYSQGTSGTLISSTDAMVNTTWLFQTSISSGLNANMNLTWSPTTEVNGFIHTGDYISHYTSGAWDNIGDSLNATAVTGGMFTIQRKGITSMSPFAVFDKSTLPTGINQITLNGTLEVYPIPATNNLYVKNNTGINGSMNADILNILGQVVATFEITNSNTTIPIDGLPVGNYFIRFHNDDMSVVRKFIKL